MPESYTRRENRQRVGLTFRGVRRAIAGADMSDLEARGDRIRDRAEERGEREQAVEIRNVNNARNEVAAARVAERQARGSDKADARNARKQAEADLRRVERNTRHI
ncbi:hypothetical protein ACFCWG_24820 [Streptomyces sp. NPDC056390]|uniref:hypothetical protein n=1 Tax=Streptomyces sp. NPDC056390 TaxID=3345806 RepID=UPI0035DFE090